MGHRTIEPEERLIWREHMHTNCLQCGGRVAALIQLWLQTSSRYVALRAEYIFAVP